MAGTLQGAISTMTGAGGSLVPDSSFTAWAINASSAPGDTAIAEFTMLEDGTVTGFAADVDTSTPGSSEWFTPTGGTPGIGYYVRYSVTSGAATTNSASAFISMASPRNINVASSAGSGGCTFTILIATDIGGTNVVFTKAGNTLAYSH